MIAIRLGVTSTFWRIIENILAYLESDSYALHMFELDLDLEWYVNFMRIGLGMISTFRTRIGSILAYIESDSYALHLFATDVESEC